jgi:hypothetical protein
LNGDRAEVLAESLTGGEKGTYLTGALGKSGGVFVKEALRVLVRRRVEDGLGARLKSDYFLFCC